MCYWDGVLLVAFRYFFHLELKQSMQRDQQGHQLKALRLFVCGGLEGEFIAFMNRYNGPANAVQTDLAAILAGITPLNIMLNTHYQYLNTTIRTLL